MQSQSLPLNTCSQSLPFTEVGIDEAGRGCLAGPVVAAAVLLPADHTIIGLNDSKKLSASKRQDLVQAIYVSAKVGIGIVWQEDIDKINILQATFHAMAKAVVQLAERVAAAQSAYNDPFQPFLHIDGNKVLPPHVIATYLQTIPLKQKAIVGGDGLMASIAAASIVAKTHRDKLMEEFDVRWPAYNFAKHKGYGTKEHLHALEKYGHCPLHRLTFEPLKSMVAQGASGTQKAQWGNLLR